MYPFPPVTHAVFPFTAAPAPAGILSSRQRRAAVYKIVVDRGAADEADTSSIASEVAATHARKQPTQRKVKKAPKWIGIDCGIINRTDARVQGERKRALN